MSSGVELASRDRLGDTPRGARNLLPRAVVERDNQSQPGIVCA